MTKRVGWQLCSTEATADSCPWCGGAGQTVDPLQQRAELYRELPRLREKGVEALLLSMSSLLNPDLSILVNAAQKFDLQIEFWSCSHRSHRKFLRHLQNQWKRLQPPTFRLSSGTEKEWKFLNDLFPTQRNLGHVIVWQGRKESQTLRRLQQQMEKSSNKAYVFLPFYKNAKRDGERLLRLQQVAREFLDDDELKTLPGYEYAVPNPWHPLKSSLPNPLGSVKDSDPEVSVVIPAHCRSLVLKKTLMALAQQQEPPSYEVIILDDGSPEPLRDLVDEFAANFRGRLVYRRFEKEKSIRQGGYRAGLMRNLGAELARGEILSFLDADILVSPQYLRQVCKKLATSKVASQAIRYDLCSNSPLPYLDNDSKNLRVRELDAYWREFTKSSRNWPTLEHPWKYVCTHSFSIRRKSFWSVGGFRECFQDYGYEDVDFGYRFMKAGGTFEILETPVYHQLDDKELSGFSLSRWKRLQALSRSGALFYRNNFDSEVGTHLRYLFEPKTSRVVKFKTLLDGVLENFIK